MIWPHLSCPSGCPIFQSEGLTKCSKATWAWGWRCGQSWEALLCVWEQASEAMWPCRHPVPWKEQAVTIPKRGALPAWSLRQNLRQQKVLGSDTGSPAKTLLQLPVVSEKPS